MQAVGIALFAVILFEVDLGEIAQAYRSVHAGLAALAVVLLFTLVLLKAQRWKTIVSWQGIDVGIWRAFRIYAASLFLGVVTPGHIGDFAKSIYLSNLGFSAGRAVMSSVADRLFDIGALGVVCFASLLAFPGLMENQLLIGISIFIVVAAVMAAFLYRRDILLRAMRLFVRAFPSNRIRGSAERAIAEGLDEFSMMDRKRVFAVSLLTAAAWLMHYSFFIVLSQALSIGASSMLVCLAVSIAIVISLVPVSISGLGTRDLALIFIFGRYGYSRDEAVTFSFAFIVSYLILGSTGFVCYLFSPFDASKGVASKGNQGKVKDARKAS